MKSLKQIFIPHPSDAQQKVINTTKGAMVVIAGPGSGKTATMVNRIVYMLANGAKPEEFFISTFTNKATDELKNRIDVACENLYQSQIINERINTDEMRIGTLHSLFYKLLQDYGPDEYADFEILDELSHIHSVMGNKSLDLREIPNLWKLIKDGNDNIIWPLSRYFQAKNFVTLYDNIVSSDAVDVFKNSTEPPKFLYENKKFNRKYYVHDKKIGEAVFANQQAMKSDNKISYVDIENILHKVIEQNQLNLANPHKPFSIKHIIVDEYQDTSELQHKIILSLYGALQAPDKSICVVGDDDQSLYRFRRAEVKNILNFDSQISGPCKTVVLEENYRSQPQIIDFYSNWMLKERNNITDYCWGTNRKSKTLVSQRSIDEENKLPITVAKCHAAPKTEWCEEILKLLHHLKDNKVIYDYNQVAFLASSIKSESVSDLMDYLESNGIKIYAPSAARFIKSSAVKNAICALFYCYFTTAQNSNFINQGLIKENDWIAFKKGFPSLVEWSNDCRTNPAKHAYPFSALFYEMMSYEPFKTHLDFTNSTDESIIEAGNLKILLDLILSFEKIKKIGTNCSNLSYFANMLFNEYLVQAILDGVDEYEIEDITTPDGHVYFSTIHSSKGLQFPVVIVGGLEDLPMGEYSHINKYVKKKIGIFDEQYLTNSRGWNHSYEDEMEFKRKYYTAFSRAQDLLILSGHYQNISNHNGKNYIANPGDYFCASYNELPNYYDVDFNGKHVSELKPTGGLKSYSFTTDISVYETCPFRYKYMRQLGLSTATPVNLLFGTLVHESIEEIHKLYLLGKTIADGSTVEKIVNSRFAILKNKHGANIPFKPERAVKVVQNYVNNNRDLIARIKDAEYKVSNVEDNYILQGNIDLVANDADGSVELLDFKTGKIPASDSPMLQKYYHQMLTYAHLIQAKTGQKVSGLKLMFPGEPLQNDAQANDTLQDNAQAIDTLQADTSQNDALSNNKTNGVVDLALNKSPEEIKTCCDSYIKQCDEIISKIENNDFSDKAKDKENCKYCPLVHFCSVCKY